MAQKRKADDLFDDLHPFKLPKQQSINAEEEIMVDYPSQIEKEIVIKGFTAELLKQRVAEKPQQQEISSTAHNAQDDFQWIGRRAGMFIHNEEGLHGV